MNEYDALNEAMCESAELGTHNGSTANLLRMVSAVVMESDRDAVWASLGGFAFSHTNLVLRIMLNAVRG